MITFLLLHGYSKQYIELYVYKKTVKYLYLTVVIFISYQAATVTKQSLTAVRHKQMIGM